EAAMRFAEQIADRARLAARRPPAFTEVQHRVDGAAESHLVIESGQRNIVALTDLAVGPDQEPGYYEQRYPLGARRPARDLRQHQVHDIVAEFVVAAGDPHLGAEQPVGAVLTRFGAGDDIGQ